MQWLLLMGMHSAHRCRDKKGEDPCVKSPESECKFCIVLTPEQLTQLSTPSYRLKKEKREAKKLEATPSKDSTLVNPSSVAIIGPVSDTATASSPPPVVPEKKVKKDKPSSSKSKKSDKSVEDSKYDELDKKWTDRFNRLEALLMTKSLQPADQPTSASVRVPPSHSPPVAVSKDSEPFFQPITTGRTGTDSSTCTSVSQPGSDVSPPAKHTGKDISASQHLSSSQLVSDRQTVRSSSPKHTGTDSSAKHQSAASLNQTDTGQDFVHLGALARTPLFQYNSQPASLVPTGTDLLHRVVPTLLPPDIFLLARSSLTDLSLLWPPTPARLPCIDRDGTVLLVQALLLVVITQTGHLLTCTQRRENFQRTRTVLLPNPTKLLVKNRHIEKP